MSSPNNLYRQLIAMFGSDSDGEALAAVRALGRALKADGRDFHWLAAVVDSHRPKTIDELYSDISDAHCDRASAIDEAIKTGNYDDRYWCIKGEMPTFSEGQVCWLFDNEPFIASEELLNNRDRALLRRMRTKGGWPCSDTREHFLKRNFRRCWAARDQWDTPEYREALAVAHAAREAAQAAQMARREAIRKAREDERAAPCDNLPGDAP